jgi:hypothetical protein
MQDNKFNTKDISDTEGVYIYLELRETRISCINMSRGPRALSFKKYLYNMNMIIYISRRKKMPSPWTSQWHTTPCLVYVPVSICPREDYSDRKRILKTRWKEIVTEKKTKKHSETERKRPTSNSQKGKKKIYK